VKSRYERVAPKRAVANCSSVGASSGRAYVASTWAVSSV